MLTRQAWPQTPSCLLIPRCMYSSRHTPWSMIIKFRKMDLLRSYLTWWGTNRSLIVRSIWQLSQLQIVAAFPSGGPYFSIDKKSILWKPCFLKSGYLGLEEQEWHWPCSRREVWCLESKVVVNDFFWRNGFNLFEHKQFVTLYQFLWTKIDFTRKYKQVQWQQ